MSVAYNAASMEGKRARLAGKPIDSCPYRQYDQSWRRFDWRCGWIVADAFKERYPDWTDEFILEPAQI